MEASLGKFLHKRRKKGVRQKFDRRKSHRCKENIPPPNNHFTPLLPQHWQVHAGSEDGIQYAKLQEKSSEMCQVSASVALLQDGTWTAFFQGQKIPANNAILSRFPHNITSSCALQELIVAVDSAALCPGNPEDNIVSVCKKRSDEKIRGERGFGQTIGYVDDRDSQGKACMHLLIATNHTRCTAKHGSYGVFPRFPFGSERLRGKMLTPTI